MKKTFICLANSYKEGGRCVAGIEINGDKIIIQNNKPKWIRPICKTEHGEVPLELVSHLKLLDIVQVEVIQEVPDGFQSENVLFDTNSIKVISTFSTDNLSHLCDNSPNVIFGNRGKAISEEKIGELTHSLRMIFTQKFDFYEKIFEGDTHPRLRLKFVYNSHEYDLPITDPVFIDKYKKDKNILTIKKELYLILSVGRIHEGWYYKLIAGIL